MIVRSNTTRYSLAGSHSGKTTTLGYYLFDVPSALLFGFLTCFATVIPIVGTALVWFPLAAYLALSGDWTHAVGLLLYCGLIVTNIDCNISLFVNLSRLISFISLCGMAKPPQQRYIWLRTRCTNDRSMFAIFLTNHLVIVVL